MIDSYSAARAAGAKKYFTGKPCKYGHLAERLASTGSCTRCNEINNLLWDAAHRQQRSEAAKSRRQENPEKQREAVRRHYISNKEKRLAFARRYAEKHRILIAEKRRLPASRVRDRERLRKWRKDNPESVKMSTSRRRAVIGNHSRADISEILGWQRNKCAYCRVSLRKGFHLDHILPIAKGGSNFRANLQALCPDCNLRKNAKHPIEFAQNIGLLL